MKPRARSDVREPCSENCRQRNSVGSPRCGRRVTRRVKKKGNRERIDRFYLYVEPSISLSLFFTVRNFLVASLPPGEGEETSDERAIDATRSEEFERASDV